MVTRSLVDFGLVLLIISGSLVAAADIPWQVRASSQLAKYDYELRRSPSAAGVAYLQAYHKTSQILDLFKSASAHTTNLAR
jgi:amino acid transporter